MSTSQPQNRWWESYLVRYFMPSIAGAGFVLGLSYATPELGQILLIDAAKTTGTGYGLLLIFLYGSFYCYMASLPILVFHATRVLDFKDEKWKPSPYDGYIASILSASLLFIIQITTNPYSTQALSILILILYVSIQIYRLYKASQPTKKKSYVNKYPNTSDIYAYTARIATRRALRSSSNSKDFTDKSRIREEITESYRHLREHGNSAFIYIHECILAMLIYSIIKIDTFNTIPPLSRLAIILAIWSIPAMFTHCLGQHLERRFSKYDIKLEDA